MSWSLSFDYRTGYSENPFVDVSVATNDDSVTLEFKVDSGASKTIANGDLLSRLGFSPPTHAYADGIYRSRGEDGLQEIDCTRFITPLAETPLYAQRFQVSLSIPILRSILSRNTVNR